MKINYLYLIFFVSAFFISCEKKFFDKKHKGCSQEECDTSCNDGMYEDPYNYGEGLTQHIIEPLEIDQNTGCIVAGAVKYLKNGKTVALVYYGEDSSKKILCVNGDCDDKDAICCSFVQVCDTDGPN